jgi:hypothetical protein
MQEQRVHKKVNFLLIIQPGRRTNKCSTVQAKASRGESTSFQRVYEWQPNSSVFDRCSRAGRREEPSREPKQVSRVSKLKPGKNLTIFFTGCEKGQRNSFVFDRRSRTEKGRPSKCSQVSKLKPGKNRRSVQEQGNYKEEQVCVPNAQDKRSR